MTDLWGALSRTETSGTVSFERRYSTTIEDLWECLTQPERLARWFAPVELSGKRYLIIFDADDPQQRSGGEILTCDAPTTLELSWISPDEERPSQVRVRLSRTDGGTLLSLVHSGLERDGDIGYAAGWEVYLRQLQASLNGDAHPDFWNQWADLRDRYAKTLPSN